jgi:hypothetical protein
LPRSSDRRSGDRHRKVQSGCRHAQDDLDEMRRWAAVHQMGLSEFLDRVFRAYAETHGVDGSPRTDNTWTERQDPEAWTQDGRFVGYGYEDYSQPNRKRPTGSPRCSSRR